MKGELWQETDLGEDEFTKDVRVEMRIKNNILWDAIHEKFPNVAAFCKTHEKLAKCQSAVGELLNFKEMPFKKKRNRQTKVTYFTGEYRDVCLLVAQVLGMIPEDLFPEELYLKFVGGKTAAILEVSSFTALPKADKEAFLALPAPETDIFPKVNLLELADKLEEVMKTLTYREREMLKMRYGLGDGCEYTLEELARIFKISQARVGQILAKGLRKLQSPIRSRKLESFMEWPEPQSKILEVVHANPNDEV